MPLPQCWYRAHGWLMAVSWGFLIPLGMIIARTLKDREPLWFHLHRACMMAGLALGLAGFVIAVTLFETDGNVYHRNLGIAVMALGLAQPLNAAIRPEHVR